MIWDRRLPGPRRAKQSQSAVARSLRSGRRPPVEMTGDRGGSRGPRCAKQTQFAKGERRGEPRPTAHPLAGTQARRRPVVSNKPNLLGQSPGAGSRGRQTKPISALSGLKMGIEAENNANFKEQMLGRAPACNPRASVGGTDGRPGAPRRQTKPIPSAEALAMQTLTPRAEADDARPSQCAKQSQFRRGPTEGDR